MPLLQQLDCSTFAMPTECDTVNFGYRLHHLAMHRLLDCWNDMLTKNTVLTLQQVREELPADNVMLFVSPNRYIVVDAPAIQHLYRFGFRNLTCIQHIFQPVVRPGPIHLFLTLKYNSRLLELLQRDSESTSLHSSLIERVHLLLYQFLSYNYTGCKVDLKTAIHDSVWQVKASSPQSNSYIAHFPRIAFKSVPKLHSFLFQFHRFCFEVDRAWTDCQVSAPLIVNHQIALIIGSCCVGDVVPVPFMLPGNNDPRRWHVCRPYGTVSSRMAPFFTSVCYADAICINHMLNKTDFNAAVSAVAPIRPLVGAEPRELNSWMRRVKCEIEYDERIPTFLVSQRFLNLLKTSAGCQDAPDSFLFHFDQFITSNVPCSDPFMQVPFESLET